MFILKYKNIVTVIIKKTCLQNSICHKVDPSNDFTIKPPKLRQNAPRKINNGPGNFEIKFI